MTSLKAWPERVRALFRSRLWRCPLVVLRGREMVRAVEILQAGTPRERWEAAQALRALPVGEKEVRALVEALDDPEPFVRWEAAETLIGQERVSLEPCLQRVRQGNPVAGLAQAVRVLGVLGDETALSALVAYADHPHPEVRVAVAGALAHFPEEGRAQEGLRALVNDPDPVVRRAAVWALRAVGDAWAHEILAERAGTEPLGWLQEVMEASTGVKA